MTTRNGRTSGDDVVFYAPDTVFAALDSLPPPVRHAIYEAPIPWSPVQIADIVRRNGPETTAQMVRNGSARVEREAMARIDAALGRGPTRR